MSPRSWTYLTLALALLTRVTAAFILGDGFHFYDETVYADAARSLIEQGTFPARYVIEPGHALLLASIDLLTPAGVIGMRIGQAVLTAAGALVVLWLGQAMFGPMPARIAALLYAVDPTMVISGALLFPEALAGVLMMMTLLASLHAWQRASVPYAGLVGGLLGLLALTRPVALILFPVLVFWFGAQRQRGVRLAQIAALALCFGATLAPWTYRNYVVHGKFVPISMSGARNAFILSDDATTDIEVARERARLRRERIEREGVGSSILGFAWNNPGIFTARVCDSFLGFWELYPTRLMTDDAQSRRLLNERTSRLPTEASFPRSLRDWVSAATFAPELALGLIGMVIGLRRYPKETLILASIILAYAFGYSLFIGKIRYRVPVLPGIYLLSGLAAATAYAAYAKRKHGSAVTLQVEQS